MIASVILAAGFASVAYFGTATVVGIYTGYDPFETTTPRFYRIFLWPAAKIWNSILPGLGGVEK